MAMGLGQFDASFATPDFPAGATDWAAMAGIQENNPYVTGPAVGGMPSTTSSPGETGLVHVNAGSDTTSMQHWSNLFDWRNGPMFWLLIAAILYLGLISVNVTYRVGRR